MSQYTKLGFQALYGSSSGPFEDTLAATVTGATLQQFATDIADSALFQDQAVNTDRNYFDNDDFVGINSNGPKGWIGTQSGAGAIAGASGYGVDSTEKAMGVISLSTGTTSTGYAEYYKSPAGMVAGVGNFLRVRARIGLQTLSNGSERYQSIFGFGDSTSAADSTNGAYFRYKDDVNSGMWEAVTSNGGVRTATNTGVTATTAYSIFEVRVNATATSVEFYINDTLVATNTTNLPTSSTTFGIYWAILKSVGTTARVNYMDWYDFLISFTSAR